MFVSEQPKIQQLVELKIVRQPNSVYRMRYKTDTRQTNLFADDSNQSDDNQNEMDTTPVVAPSTSAASSSVSLLSKAKKLPPKVQIVNATGPGMLRVTCVCPESPYHVHPNFLYGLYCANGIAEIPIESGVNSIELKDIRIELVKKSEIKMRIEELKRLNIDPFQAGYEIDYNSIDLGRLRLCFQVFFSYSQYATVASPIVSNIISTNKQKISILIQKKANMNSLVSGGADVVLFVKKLEKDQKPIIAKFFDNAGWCSSVDIKDIHYRCAMIFKAPAYKNINITNDIQVNLQLVVPSEKDSRSNSSLARSSSFMPKDKYVSEIVEFTYTPIKSEIESESKRKKIDDTIDNTDLNLNLNFSNFFDSFDFNS